MGGSGHEFGKRHLSPRGGLLRASGPHEEPQAYALRRFEALFRQNADTVLAYAARRSDLDTAQEVVAETFAVAWRRLDVVPDPALPWLLGVARKVLANERRSRSRAEALTLRLGRESVASSDDPADVVDARLSAQAALDRLLPAEREVLELLGGTFSGPGCRRAEVLPSRDRSEDASRTSAIPPASRRAHRGSDTLEWVT